MTEIIKAAQHHVDKVALACMFGVAGLIFINFPHLVVYAVAGN